MSIKSNVQVILDLSNVDPNWEAEELEAFTRDFKNEIQDLVEDAQLVRETEIPKRGKPALGGFILGLLKTEVNVKNVGAFLGFLGNRLSGKSIEMTIKAPNGKELSIKAGNREEFTFVMQQAKEFLDQP